MASVSRQELSAGSCVSISGNAVWLDAAPDGPDFVMPVKRLGWPTGASARMHLDGPDSSNLSTYGSWLYYKVVS